VTSRSVDQLHQVRARRAGIEVGIHGLVLGHAVGMPDQEEIRPAVGQQAPHGTLGIRDGATGDGRDVPVGHDARRGPGGDDGALHEVVLSASDRHRFEVVQVEEQDPAEREGGVEGAPMRVGSMPFGSDTRGSRWWVG
jgi:hypothetical protein